MKTYGTVTRKNTSWVIETEPHVVVRLKRVFPRLSRQQGTRITIKDTLETCRDLAWFFERYPMVVAEEAHLLRRAEQHRESATIVHELFAGLRQPRSFDLALPARDYQRLAAELALRTRGLLIADDVGLGKTCQAICMLTDPSTRPALVVTLTHLTRQWENEIRKFAPSLTTHILKKGSPYNYTAQANLFSGGHPDVLICNYHKLAGWSETLAGLVKSVIFDEVHELRSGPQKGNDGSAKGTAARVIAEAAEYRLGLTATPIFNYGGEFFNVLETLRPGALGSKTEFLTEWCVGFPRPQIQAPKQFGAYVRDEGYMLRRTRKEVARELPTLTRAPHHVDADPDRLAQIDTAAGELARIILNKASRALAQGEQFRAGGELEGLVRQATGIAKAPAVAAFVRMLVENGERVVLYGWHREVYKIWLERLKEFKPALYTGSESANQKDEAKRRFVEKETPILIISLRSGAGLDGLQYAECRNVVFGELDWSPACHEQCEGRVHRDGQDEPVCAYYLITDQGSDPIVADVLGVKRGQLEGLRDPQGNAFAEVDVGGDRARQLAEMYLRRRGAAA